jgi:hypothetical protein
MPGDARPRSVIKKLLVLNRATGAGVYGHGMIAAMIRDATGVAIARGNHTNGTSRSRKVSANAGSKDR